MAVDDLVVMGINLSHDLSCAAVVGGEVRVAMAEERFTRVKYCSGLTELGKVIPFGAIHTCCEHLGIAPAEVDLWVANSCRSNAVDVLRRQLLGIPSERVIDLGHPGHHLAHAWSAFWCSPFERAATIVLDTNGSFVELRGPRGPLLEKKEHYGCYLGDGVGLQLVERDFVLPGEVSLGELYCIYSAALQLTPTPGPYGLDDPLSAGGKLMGLAAYGRRPVPLPPLWHRNGAHLKVPLTGLVERLQALGVVDEVINGAELDRRWGFQLSRWVRLARRRRSLRNPPYLDLASEAQAVLEEALLDIGRRASQATGARDLCLAGGTTLNVIASTRLLEETPFERVFIQPAAGDAGNAIGAALWGYAQHLGGCRRPYLNRPYSTFLGPEYPAAEIERAVRAASHELVVSPVPSLADKVEALAPHLLAEEIVAVFAGRSEFGPRALGNRSFLASPRRRAMRIAMNRLKGREWYRPVAPVVPEERFEEYFSAPYDTSPFMTLSAQCTDRTRKLAPAVCHVDGSARPQTVSAENNPLLHRLLMEFERGSGVAILVNTSLNFAGEPIVETPHEALQALHRGETIQALLVGDWLVEKTPAKHR